MTQGTVKDYDIEGRTGSLLLDDRTEVVMDEASLEGSGHRYLRLGQRVSLDVVEEGGRKVARNVRVVTFT